jgi:hypothetical protein
MPLQQALPAGQQTPLQHTLGQQPLPHLLKPRLQIKSQFPLEQVGLELAGPGGQTLPQIPQLVGSVFVSMQTLLQHAVPDGQASPHRLQF